MPCPVGADRMRAPLALGANEGSAMRHRRDEANIRLCDSRVNPPSSDLLRVIDRLPPSRSCLRRAARVGAGFRLDHLGVLKLVHLTPDLHAPEARRARQG